MKIVVDSNIVFSALLNTQSKIGNLLINGKNKFDFYSIDYLKEEINSHKSKILDIAKYSQGKYEELYSLITSKIIFINQILLPDSVIDEAFSLTKNIDENDTLFLALSLYLNTPLWTGDKKLITGLRIKGFNNFMNTEQLNDIYYSQL